MRVSRVHDRLPRVVTCGEERVVEARASGQGTGDTERGGREQGTGGSEQEQRAGGREQGTGNRESGKVVTIDGSTGMEGKSTGVNRG